MAAFGGDVIDDGETGSRADGTFERVRDDVRAIWRRNVTVFTRAPRSRAAKLAAW